MVQNVRNLLLICVVSAGFGGALAIGSQTANADGTTVAVSQCEDTYRWDQTWGPIQWPPQPCSGQFTGGGVEVGSGQPSGGSPRTSVGNGR